jgi:hypothetical protein
VLKTVSFAPVKFPSPFKSTASTYRAENGIVTLNGPFTISLYPLSGLFYKVDGVYLKPEELTESINDQDIVLGNEKGEIRKILSELGIGSNARITLTSSPSQEDSMSINVNTRENRNKEIIDELEYLCQTFHGGELLTSRISW